VGFVAFVLGLLAVQFRVRCPRCHGALGRISVSFTGMPFWFPKRLKFCADCGLDLDSPLEAQVISKG
jgi:hypothetical protein